LADEDAVFMYLMISADPWHTIVVGFFGKLNLHDGGFGVKGTRLRDPKASDQKESEAGFNH
jgi:hypothetical protein